MKETCDRRLCKDVHAYYVQVDYKAYNFCAEHVTHLPETAIVKDLIALPSFSHLQYVMYDKRVKITKLGVRNV